MTIIRVALFSCTLASWHWSVAPLNQYSWMLWVQPDWVSSVHFSSFSSICSQRKSQWKTQIVVVIWFNWWRTVNRLTPHSLPVKQPVWLVTSVDEICSLHDILAVSVVADRSLCCQSGRWSVFKKWSSNGCMSEDTSSLWWISWEHKVSVYWSSCERFSLDDGVEFPQEILEICRVV